jgi:hypothetical protein
VISIKTLVAITKSLYGNTTPKASSYLNIRGLIKKKANRLGGNLYVEKLFGSAFCD